MGQYLAIGIVNRITVSIREMQEFKLEKTELLQQLENTLFFPLDLYDIADGPLALVLSLKKSVLASELIPFLEKFYRLMYTDKEAIEVASITIEKLKTTSPSEWLA